MSTGKARRPRRTAGTPAPRELRAKAQAGLLTARDLAELRRWRETRAPAWLRRENTDRKKKR